MWKVYSDIAWRMMSSLGSAIYGVEAIVGVAIWLATVYSSAFSLWIEEKTGLDDRWMWIPLGLLFLHLLFKAIHERNRAWEDSLVERVTKTAESNGVLAREQFLADRQDLEHLRTLLNQQADAAEYFFSPFDPVVATKWSERVQMIFKGNLKPEKASSWPGLARVDHPGQLQTKITFLRSLAVGLRVSDLRQ